MIFGGVKNWITLDVGYLTTDDFSSRQIITDQNGVVVSRTDFGAFGEETMTPRQAAANRDVTTRVNTTRDTEGNLTDQSIQNVFDGRRSALAIDVDRNPATSQITIAEFFRADPTVNPITVDGLKN